MMLFKLGKHLALSLLIASTMSSDVFAETVVHTERIYNRTSVAQGNDSDREKINSGQNDPLDKASAQNVSNEMTVAVEHDIGTKETSENTSPNSDTDMNLTPPTENMQNIETTLDNKEANSSKRKKSRYIEGFKIKGPVIVTQSQEGAFLYTSKLYEENEDYGNFTFWMQKVRAAAVLGPSYVSTSFSCSWSIDFDALISKNHKPQFILIDNDGIEQILELNMSRYAADYFVVESPKWGSLLQNAHKVYLELSSQSGDNVRLPIPIDAIEQWNTVINADMKKVKKEFENK